MVDHVYGSLGPPKSDIPGEEASTIGVRFHMLPNGEVHVSELLPGTPASNALQRPQVGDQLFRVNGTLLPALIGHGKLTLLLAQQCYESDTISLSFRTDSLEEYTSVIHLTAPITTAPPRMGLSGGNTAPGIRRSLDANDKSLSRSPEKNISFSDPLTRSPSPDRDRSHRAFLPIGLSASDPRWAQFGSAEEKEAPSNSLTSFLNDMRLELSRVRDLAQKKVHEAEKRRVEAEEDLEALQEQTFTRVQMMQEQITALRAENQSLRAEVQQINRTVRTRNMPLCPACNRVNLQGLQHLQEGAVLEAAAALGKARSLLDSDKSAEGDAARRLPVTDAARRLPVTPAPASLHKHASSSAPAAAERALPLGHEASWHAAQGNHAAHAAQANHAARAPSYGEGGDIPHLSSIISSSPLQGPRGAGYGDATGGRGLGQGVNKGEDGGAETGDRSRGLHGERVPDSVLNGWEGGRQGMEEGRSQGRSGRRGSVKMEDGSLLAVDPRTGRVLADSESGLQLL